MNAIILVVLGWPLLLMFDFADDEHADRGGAPIDEPVDHLEAS